MGRLGEPAWRVPRWPMFLAAFLAGCEMTEADLQTPAPESPVEAIEARNAVMGELAQDAREVAARLIWLETQEKNAVIALLTLSNAVAAYERAGLRIDQAPLESYYRSLRELSPGYAAPGQFQSVVVLACFDASVSCASAQKSCRDAGREDFECDEDPDVIEACGAEAACMYEAFLDLGSRLPQILGGRDPWPRPFPY